MSNFDEYIRQGEPSRKAKAQIWQTAIGMQGVVVYPSSTER